VKCVWEEAYVLPLNGAKFRFHIISSFWIRVWFSEELLVVWKVHFGGSLVYDCTFDFTYFKIFEVRNIYCRMMQLCIHCSFCILRF
jgi:hypothetical protein